VTQQPEISTESAPPRKSRRGMVLLALAVPVAAGAMFAASPELRNQAVAAKPVSDGNDTAALQELIDAAAKDGGGIVQLDARTYRVSSPIYLRDGVTLRGAGPKTKITNVGLNSAPLWGGVVLFAGNIGPASYSGAIGIGYPGHRSRRIDTRTLDVTDCDPAALPRVGQVVWTASEALETGNRGVPLPEYGEINAVTAVSDCRISLADPISAPAGMPIDLHWSDGSTVRPLDVPNVPIRDAGVENLTLESERSEGIVVSGCYRCRFTDLVMARTQRLFPVQGTRGSLFENISGTFTKRGIEFAMYGTGNTIRNIRGTYRYEPDVKPRPAIRFGEYARDNIIEDVVLDLRDRYSEKVKIRFDGSGGNKLRDIQILVADRPDQHDAVMYRAANSQAVTDRRPEGTVIERVRMCRNEDDENGCVARD